MRGGVARRLSSNGRPRRPMDWECGDYDVSNLGVESANCHWAIPPSVFRDGYTDPTLMASIIYAQIGPLGASTVSSTFGIGLIVWNGVDDTDPPAGECPQPITNCDADWIWHWIVPAIAGQGNGFSYQNWSADGLIRSKAKRRLGNDKGLLWASENRGPVAAQLHAHGRFLIKE